MDALALALLWIAVVVPISFAAARRRRDSIAEFERALASLQPGGRPAIRTTLPRDAMSSTRLDRRRRVVMVLVGLVTVALVIAALSRTRLALGAGVLLVDVGLAYGAATVAADRRLST